MNGGGGQRAATVAFFAAGLAGVVSVRLPFWADRGLTSLTGATAAAALVALIESLAALTVASGVIPNSR